jgi:4-amino-4-deoxy-L-arabinose transferase-like glycosyltransferase
MSQQSDRTLPELAGRPFLEKPPLSYWMSAAGLELFGSSPAAARSPNILYAGATALAIGALAFTMSGGAAAIVAALVTASLLIVFRVTVWLAPDAGLLAGCAVAILGAYLGYTAPPGRRKLLGYALMHLGAALGFMAKSAPGWMAPALALGTLIVWERRWSELARWELYAGLVLQALVIGPWIWAVMQTPSGMDSLAALFWHNVIGRFTKVAAPAALDYSTGHKNTPGKYLIELPVYLLPWTLLVVAALRKAWARVRTKGLEGTPWRFAIAAAVPFLIVLSIAATARDIYSAPALLGLGVLVGLWMVEAQRSPTRLDGWAMRATRWLVALIGCGFALFAGVMAFATAQYAYLLATAATLVGVFEATRRSVRAQTGGDLRGSFGWMYGSYVLALSITALAVFPAIDRWHDLAGLAGRIHNDSEHCDLALLNPDETTVAMLDHGLRTSFAILDPEAGAGGSSERLVADWLSAHGATACVLVLLPGHAPGELTRLVASIHPLKPPDDGIAGTLKSQGTASLLHRYEIPQGRRYALLGPPDAGTQ